MSTTTGPVDYRALGPGFVEGNGTIDPAVLSVSGKTGAVELDAVDVGALATANNLSDVQNAGSAASNLGLGAGDSVVFGTINTGTVSATFGNFGSLNGTVFNTFAGTAAVLQSLTISPPGTAATSSGGLGVLTALVPDVGHAFVDSTGTNIAAILTDGGRFLTGSVQAGTGTIALLNSGTIAITGSASAGSLSVAGSASAGSMSVGGSLSVGGTASVTGPITVGGSGSVGGALAVGGSLSVVGAFAPNALGFNATTLSGFALTPDIGSVTQDSGTQVSAYTDNAGVQHFGSVNIGTATINGPLNAANFKPASLPFGTSTLAATGSVFATGPLVPDFQQLAIDSTGSNAVGGIRGGGALHMPLASTSVAQASQAQVKRTFRMTQACPTLIGAALQTADSGPTTYFLCCTLDTAGFDAVRLLIGNFQPTAGQNITGIVAWSSEPNDYINPVDSTGTTAVPWTPVTFNNGGTDIDWADQSLGLGLAISQQVTVGTTLYFASGVSAIAAGAPVNGKVILPQTTVVSVNAGTSPQQVVLSQAPNFTDVGNINVGEIVSFGTISSTIAACGTALAVGYTVTDWIPCSSEARIDGGRWPILMARIYADGTPTPANVSPNSGTLHAGWANAIGDRIWSCYSQLGDHVSSPSGASPGADNGKMLVIAVQYMSRSRGMTMLALGDSVVNGVSNTGATGVSGIGAGAFAAMSLSTVNCPVTWCTLGSWGVNNAGVCEVYYPTGLKFASLFAPNIFVPQSWSRNDFLNTTAFTQADADWQWQQNMAISEKMQAKFGAQTLVFGAWANNSMTSTTDPVRVSSLTRGAQFQASGGMFVNADSIVGVAGNPVTWIPQLGVTGLHLPPLGQEIYAASLCQILKPAIGIP